MFADRNGSFCARTPLRGNQNLKTVARRWPAMAAAQTALMRNDARARCSPPLAVGRKTYGSEALALMGRERNAPETMTVSGRRVLIFGAGNCYDPYLPAADADEGVERVVIGDLLRGSPRLVSS
jgi:hypothetical protein